MHTKRDNKSRVEGSDFRRRTTTNRLQTYLLIMSSEGVKRMAADDGSTEVLKQSSSSLQFLGFKNVKDHQEKKLYRTTTRYFESHFRFFLLICS